jgi:two-component sensor histidine kinase
MSATPPLSDAHPARSRHNWEMIAVGLILAAFVGANVLIVLARPSMMRDAVASVNSLLERDRWTLARDLEQWRLGMLRDGRWTADLVGVMLETPAARSRGAFSDSSAARLRELIVAQMPTARAWVLDSQGRVLAAIGADQPSVRHRRLATMSLARDSALLAASDVRNGDLRLAVASPVRSSVGRGIVTVLDLSAETRLRRRMPSVAWEGHAGRAALNFPWDSGFVGTTWSGDTAAPTLGWPETGWSLTDSSLIVQGDALPDQSARFELAIPRSAAESRIESRVAWMHASTALVAFPLSLVVLLVGRTRRNERLRAAEVALAESQVRAARAEAAATRAELAAIQARLNPHFLSNALHSVSALISTDPEAAEEALDRLGDLFRYSLEMSERRVVRLADEWQFVKDYLAIEQLRLGGRLTTRLELDPSAATCEVPSFVLQPLVENAVRHGIGPRRAGGTVRVSARRDGSRLELTVEDDGVGGDPAAVRTSKGTGLRTLRERLALEGSLEGKVEVETSADDGFRVRVCLAALPET